MNKCYLYYSFISSVLCVSACLVFSCLYGNIQGGIWAGVAALVAGVNFYFYKLYFSNLLQYYCRAKLFERLHTVGFIIALVSNAFSIWYLFSIFYWKIPLNDYVRTLVFPCVFSFITGKWGFHLFRATVEYKNYLNSYYCPLIQPINSFLF